MILSIHYFTETGELASYETGVVEESHRADCRVICLEFTGEEASLRAGHYCVRDGELVKKSDAQIVELSQPSLHEVTTTIFSELTATDGYVDVPSDRPRKGDLLFDWKPYRQALRDLSKLPTPSDMVRQWPLRPNGADAVPHLRARL